MPVRDDAADLSTKDDQLGTEEGFIDLDQAASLLMGDEDEDHDNSVSETEDTQEDDDNENTDEDTSEEDSEEEDTEETEEDASDEEDEGEETESNFADPEAEVKVKVGDEEVTYKVKDLQRLAGQEKSLTQKSQALSEKTKEVEEKQQQYGARLQHLLKQAEEKAKMYEGIDLHIAAKHMDDEEFKLFKKDYEEAFSNYRFLQSEADNLVQDLQARQSQQIQEQVEKCKTECVNYFGEDWTPDKQKELVEFAINNGMDENSAKNILDPAAYILLDKAMKYENSKKAAKKKIKKGPKNVVTNKKKRPSKQKETLDDFLKSNQGPLELDQGAEALMKFFGDE